MSHLRDRDLLRMLCPVRRDGPKDKTVDPRQLVGLKKLRHLLPMLAELRPCGCGRDRAGNRELFFDGYVTLVLLYLFNPLLDSLRGLQQASGLERVADALGA